MTSSQSNPDEGASTDVWEYADAYYKDPAAVASVRMLSHYRPEVAEGYIRLRQAAYSTSPDSVLDDRTKELIILAIECAAGKSNPPPLTHARLAVEAGASLQEIAEVVALCIPIAGMLSYQQAGRYALEEAERHAEHLEAAETE